MVHPQSGFVGSFICFGRLRGGREFQRRILSLGLSVGCEIEVMQGGGQGGQNAIAARMGDTRLMIGHGMAQKIIVRVAKEENEGQ